jgi:protein MpaA
MRPAAGIAATAIVAAAAGAAWALAGQAAGAGKVIDAGRSLRGREIRAVRIGEPDSERVALVVGVIHGDEPAGLRVTRALRRRYAEMKGATVWVVNSVNPDGLRAAARRNSRGVDLNRNWPYRWQGGVPRSSGYYPGPRPLSEPETRAARRLIERIRPDVSIWYHQPWGAVLACHGRPRVARRYARLSGMRTSCQGKGLRGTAIGWENHRFPGTSSFVVEFPAGRLSAKRAARHARAAAIVARGG